MGKIFAILILFFSMVTQVRADVSFVANVEVKTDADNSAEAKDQAMLKAQREAFLIVAERLTTKDNLDKLNELTDEQLMHFIREVSVVSEDSSSQSYQAEFNVAINGGLLKQYMQENGMLEALTEAVDILIVPTYAENMYAEKKIWGHDNAWRGAWLDKGQILSGIFNFKVLSDIADNRKLLNVSTLYGVDLDTYQQLAAQNKTGNVYSVHAIQSGRNSLALIIKSYPQQVEKRIMVFAEDGNVFDKAVAETVAYITQDMQGKNVIPSSEVSDIQVTYTYTRLKDMLATEKQLKEIPQIKSLQTGTAANGRVIFKMAYIGSYTRLTNALEQIGLSLFSDNGAYILKKRERYGTD